MWTRYELKSNAKVALKRYYWMGVVVCLVGGMLLNISNAGTFLLSYRNNLVQMQEIISGNSAFLATLAQMLLPIAVIACVLGVLYRIFLAHPIQVGMSRYFAESRSRQSDFGVLFWGFSDGRYSRTVKLMLSVWWRVLLWNAVFVLPGVLVCVLLDAPAFVTWPVALILCIPGSIKEYQYSQAAYLVAENPWMETRQILELSTRMTDGEKWKLFVLDLSFFGWTFLGAMLCGLGTWFVLPYIWATSAEVYALLRAKAFAMGIATPQELPGI